MDRFYTWAEHGIAEDPVRHVNAAIKEDGAQQRLEAVGHRVPAKKSVADPWHFGVDLDPDFHASD